MHSLLRVNGLKPIPRATALSAFPLLWEHARTPPGRLNAQYLDPFGKNQRDQDRYVLFDVPGPNVWAMPRPIAAASACDAAFRLIWDEAGSSANRIVGDAIEKCVAIACGRHRGRVWANERYSAGGKQLEMDIAVRDGDEVALFEAKAKSLTAVSRTGGVVKFIDDFNRSFVAALKQLVRHDRNLRLGRTPLTGSGDDPDSLRVCKVAVSPLSYGPASDHVLSNSLIHAIAGARFQATDGNRHRTRILDEFSGAIEETLKGMGKVPPIESGPLDLRSYMTDVFWLDLGQLLYALERGRSVASGLAALRHLTFCTWDFWTEAALADRQSLTEEHWKPPAMSLQRT